MSLLPTDPSGDRVPSAAEVMSRDPALIDCLYLVHNGVPFDVAFSLDDEERLAWTVIIGQLKGLTFNWISRSWERPQP